MSSGPHMGAEQCAMRDSARDRQGHVDTHILRTPPSPSLPSALLPTHTQMVRCSGDAGTASRVCARVCASVRAWAVCVCVVCAVRCACSSTTAVMPSSGTAAPRSSGEQPPCTHCFAWWSHSVGISGDRGWACGRRKRRQCLLDRPALSLVPRAPSFVFDTTRATSFVCGTTRDRLDYARRR